MQVDGGYRIGHIGDMNKFGGADYDSELNALEEVTKGNLIYDRHDVGLFKVRVCVRTCRGGG